MGRHGHHPPASGQGIPEITPPVTHKVHREAQDAGELGTLKPPSQRSKLCFPRSPHPKHTQTNGSIPISGSSGATESWPPLTPCCLRVLLSSSSLNPSSLPEHGGPFHRPHPGLPSLSFSLSAQAEDTFKAGWQQLLGDGSTSHMLSAVPLSLQTCLI